jgi:hypothetical protein
MDFSEETIQIALKRYIKDKEYRNNYYKNKYHNDPVYRENAMNLSRKYYQDNKEKIKEKYHKDKKYKNAKKLYNYYKDKDRIEDYIKNYKDDYDLFFKDK